MINKNKGSISIFVSIIFLAVFSFESLFVDVSQVKTGETQVKRKVEISLDCLLAEYDPLLKNDYGILGLRECNQSIVEDSFCEYLSENLLTELGNTNNELLFMKDKNYINLFDYRIEDIDISFLHNLSENEVLEYQILNFSKYRIPKQFVEKIIDVNNLTGDLKEECNILSKSVNVSMIFKEIYDSQKDILENVKKISDIDICNDCEEIMGNIKDLKERIKNLGESIDELRDRISDLRDEDDNKDVISKLKKRKRNLSKERSECRKKIEGLDKNFNDMIDIINNCMVNTIELSDEISRLYKVFSSEKKDTEFENILKNKSNIANLITDEFEIYDKYFSIDSVKYLKVNASKNLKIITSVKDEYKKENYDKIASLLTNYKYFDYEINSEESEQDYKKYSPIDSIKDIIPSCFSFFISNKEDFYLKQSLPSYKDERGLFPNKVYSSEINSEDNFKSENDIELSVNNKGFDFNSNGIKESFDFSKNLFESIGNIIKSGSKNIMINEYILGMFNNKLSINNDEEDMMGNEKSKKERFLKGSETEYILSNSLDEEYSLGVVQNQIAFLRLSLNLIHVYKDTAKNKFALEIATSLSGLNVATPLLHFIIMSSWAMEETKYDIDTLFNSGSVMLIKGSDDWHTDIKGLSDFKKEKGYKKTKSKVDLNMINEWEYNDYLRLLLLSKSKNIRLERIQDIIQLNMSMNNTEFNIALCNTCLKANTQVSIRYLFPNVFLLFQKKGKDRCEYNIETYKRY